MTCPFDCPERPLQSEKWRKVRATFLQSNPICAECNTAPATQIHHEPTWRLTRAPFLSTFFVPICARCHTKLTRQQRINMRFSPYGKSNSTATFVRRSRSNR